MVPKKGLEPPHPCEYIDLNHARLPIPPLRHEVSCSIHRVAASGRDYSSILTNRGGSVKPHKNSVVLQPNCTTTKNSRIQFAVTLPVAFARPPFTSTGCTMIWCRPVVN